jgi:hypothetical protein
MADKNINKNFQTPIAQLPSKISGTSFDDYVLIGKKGDQLTVYSSGSDTDTTNWLDQYQSELENAD